MKKLLLICFLFAAMFARAQTYDTRPTVLNTITSPGFYIDPATSNIWLYKGSGNWINLGSRRNMQFSIDSLSALGYKKFDVDNLLSAKVDKVTGKGLSTADVTASEKTAITHANRTSLDLVSGTNTGDNAINSQYSGLAAAKINVTEKGTANGVATLDDNAKVPLSQMNDAILGSVRYQGTWSAVSNVPAIPTASTANKGYYYVASDEAIYAGTLFKVKDWIISNGTAWQKVDNNNLIGSVFGRVGNVLANAGDYTTDQVTEGATNKYYTESRVTANASVVANTAKVSNATHTGDVTGSTALTLATVNTAVGTYNNVTVNAKGLVTGASNAGYLISYTETDPNVYPWAKAILKPSYTYSEIGGTVPTWNQSTTGNAATATTATSWNGLPAYWSGLASSMNYVIVNDGTNNRAGLASDTQLKTFLGLGSNAYTSTAYLPNRTFGTAANNNTGDFVAYRTFGTAANSASTDFAPSSTISNATHTGDVTGSTALTLATVNTAVGTYNNVTVNAKGLVTGASNAGYLISYTETDPNVYPWAKAAVKPAYIYSEVGGTVPIWNQNTTGSSALLGGWAATEGAFANSIVKRDAVGDGRFNNIYSNGNLVYHSGNFTPSNYLLLSGGTLTGAYGTAGNALEINYTQNAGGNALYLTTAHTANSDRYFINTLLSGGGNPFYVKHNGDMKASIATFSGSVTTPYLALSAATAPTTGAGWFHSGGYVQLKGGTSGLAINNAANTMTNLVITDAGNAAFSGSVAAPSFIKSGGTSAQYLLADGSVTTTAGAVYKGQINGSTGSGLADGTGTTGWYYACATAGMHNYGSGNITLAVGDQLYYNGTIWLWVPGAGAYTLPVATGSVLGGVKSSASVAVDGSGVMSVSTAYDATGTASGLFTTHNSTYNHANIANGQTAYGWGNHAGLYAPISTVSNATHTGDVTGSTALTLATVGTAGTYTKVTTDTKGRVVSGTTLSSTDVPTLNQNTTGSAAKLTTPRTINGVAFDGTADIVVAAQPIVPLDNSVENSYTGSVVYGINNPSTLPGIGAYYTPKGGHALMMFTGDFDSLVLNQGFSLMFYVDGVTERTVRSSVYGSRMVTSFQHLKTVTPGTTYLMLVQMNATANVYAANYTLTIIDLP